MITPVFEIEQDEDFVIVRLRAPHIKVSTFDFYIEEKTLKFYGKPYFLRLVFPSYIVEDGREKAAFDIDTGIVTVHIPKKNKGEHFEDLDLLTLLKKKEDNNKNKTPLISVINELETNTSGSFSMEQTNEAGEVHTVNSLEDVNFDWDYPQELRSEPSLSVLKHPYGFNNKSSDYFDDLLEELTEIMTLPRNPAVLPVEERREIRILQEQVKFDIDHYMADYMEDDMIKEILRKEVDWSHLESSSPNPSIMPMDTSVLSIPNADESKKESLFSDVEKEMLRKFPNKEYLLSKEEQRVALLNMVDMLLAFAYDVRTTFGDHTVESSWTISVISSVFSSGDSFTAIKDVISSFLSRSLVYPLYCHWQLSLRVVQDVRELLEKGKRFVLKALLAMKRTLQHSDFHNHFNKLYIDDYCVWVQSLSPTVFHSLAQRIKKLEIDQTFVCWDLGLLETTAKELDAMSDEEVELEV